MNDTIRLLHLEDDPLDAELIRHRLETEGLACEITWVKGRQDFESALERGTFDLVLSDYNLPDYDGMSAVRHIREEEPDLPVIVISGTLGEDEAVECLKAGATDYVLKQRLQRLGSAVRRALSEKADRAARRAAEEEVARQHAFLRQVIDLDRNFIFAKNREGQFVLVNKALASAYGTTVEQLLGKTDADFNANAEEVAYFRKLDLEVLDTLRELFIPEEKITNAAGKVRWLQTTKRPIMSENGTANMVLGVAVDITERKTQEDRLARLSRIHAMLSGINSTIVRIHDRTELFREACRIAVEQGAFRMAWVGLVVPGTTKAKPVVWAGFEDGYLNEVGSQLQGNAEDPGVGGSVLKGKIPVIVNDIENDMRVIFKKEALARGYRSLVVFPLQEEDRTVGVFALHAAQTGFFDRDEMALLTELAADISFALSSIAKTEEINYLAYYDVMTGLANRSLFYDRLGQLLRSARAEASKVAVTLIDIERFKFINHTLGRHGGDAVLKSVAMRLGEVVESPERIGRVGTNAFGVMIAKVEGETDIAGTVTKNLIPVLSAPMQISGQELYLSTKIGIALFPYDGTDADMLLRNAEAALENAKSSGEPFLFYAPHMNETVAEKLKLETKLRRALELEQLVLYYQPKVYLNNGQISGLEALLRWNDPEVGLVLPLKFIPLLEETGMILEAGRWALAKAVSDSLAWQSGDLLVPRIAVNVSPIQLRQKDFVKSIESVLSVAGDAGGILELEITESVIMQDIEANIEKLRAVRAMGVHVVIDDFGTGYSSLSYIAKLPINALKIDRAFIVNMTSNPDDLNIVSTIISLAHSLDMRVVAEGVETDEQANLLRLFKCDEIQGHLFSTAVPAETIEKFLREKKSLSR